MQSIVTLSAVSVLAAHARELPACLFLDCGYWQSANYETCECEDMCPDLVCPDHKISFYETCDCYCPFEICQSWEIFNETTCQCEEDMFCDACPPNYVHTVFC